MYIATIDYYDHENGHCKTTVDPRLGIPRQEARLAVRAHGDDLT